MFITKKKHTALVAALHEQIQESKETVAQLREQLRQARNLDAILNKLGTFYTDANSVLRFSASGGATFTLPESVAQYVPDFFGGIVLKQEATKVIEISPDGDVKTGLTKRAPDDGFSHILVRRQATRG